MSNFNNSSFNIKFNGTGNERTLSRMDSDEVKEFLTNVGRVTYEGNFICAAYWDKTSDCLEISHENEKSLHLKEVIENLMNN